MNEPKEKCRYKLRLCVLLLMLCSAVYSFGQATVSGKVLDGAGEPVIGASVKVKGTSLGAITDLDGMFQVTVNDLKKDVLVVSYLGYETQEIALRGRKTVSVTMSESSVALDEVAVVAYGVQKKETLTGAIASVSTDDLIQSPNASVANALAGKITGLSSVQTSGQPGAEDPKLFVRGIGSLTESGASPLVLVDGVERSFFQMDPNEIETLTVLKDASATAVFGVRGANGVILVTTRRGKEGKAKISVKHLFSKTTSVIPLSGFMPFRRLSASSVAFPAIKAASKSSSLSKATPLYPHSLQLPSSAVTITEQPALSSS